ncbi:UDP-glycosyltransferase 76E2-like [Cucumis melo var. makuwa]|uniref:UDP-glycosyltransferase 76E2-like n=1 Tax=Cucumis melo var. makuwa TaxID=1194695 RepID=A0A5D3D873_CUCMM|nr:UDP-glycosyltransferase 76E2-like [Cucumis melo var. makuwa]TYK19768.1 UDP-glycosyltransferase 76E2-like [Cucumis melo var. makuwa]
MEKKQKERKGHLVLVPCPLPSHMSPMLHLAKLLHSQGFSITVIHTQLNSPNQSHYPEFSFESIGGSMLESYSAFGGDVMLFLSELNMKSVADDLQIFRIVLRTSSAANYIGLSILDENDCHPIQERRLEEPVAGFPFLRIKDMPLFSSQKHTRKVLTCIFNGTKTASAIIWNSLWCLEHALFEKIEDETLVPVFPVGPLQKYSSNFSTDVLSEEQSCMAWLDKQAQSSVVYVSTGSVITMSKDELLEMAWGLANSDQPFLWVVRDCLVNGSDGVEQLPREFHESTRSRCRIASWLPQQKVLAHRSIGCFLTHNGWNSTIESIAEGVPMLCWPRVGDQRVNARFVSHVWRVGLQLEDRLLREEIDRAIRTLFVDEEGIQIQKRAKELKKKVEISLRQGGASSDSLGRLVKYIRLQETMIRLSNA